LSIPAVSSRAVPSNNRVGLARRVAVEATHSASVRSRHAGILSDITAPSGEPRSGRVSVLTRLCRVSYLALACVRNKPGTGQAAPGLHEYSAPIRNANLPHERRVAHQQNISPEVAHAFSL